MSTAQWILTNNPGRIAKQDQAEALRAKLPEVLTMDEAAFSSAISGAAESGNTPEFLCLEIGSVF